jgi:hypothetical protein
LQQQGLVAAAAAAVCVAACQHHPYQTMLLTWGYGLLNAVMPYAAGLQHLLYLTLLLLLLHA